MAFFETTRFPETISRGATGGPEFSTLVSANDGGYEQRNARWQYPRHSWDVAHGLKDQAGLDTLKAFFMNMQGRKTGFRFKDWSDFNVVVAESNMAQSLGGIFQLGKNYTTGALSQTRLIEKVVDTTYTIYKNAVAQTEGGSPGQYSIDITTGIVTFVADATGVISNITRASPGVITSTGHGRTSGDELELGSIGGMTELNGQTVTITVIDPNTFSIGVDTTGYTAYTSGGSWSKYAQSSDAMTWAGEFDVPARFETDQMRANIVDYNIFAWGQIPVVELRAGEA